MSNKIPAWFPPILVILVLVGLYGFSASTRLTWSNNGTDGGDFIAAILTGGIPHPTGYPTYMILGRLFQWIPVGDAYERVVWLSFLPAAFAAGLFTLLVNSFRPGMRSPGVISGLVWGLSPLLWSQAVIVEVYGLQSLFTVLALWWVTFLFRLDQNHPRLLVFLAIIFGVGLGNHITIIFFLPACIIGLIYWGRKTRHFKFVLFQIGAILLGGLIYLYLPIQASGFPPINWGNPQTIGGFIWEITGSTYQSLLGSVPFNNVLERLLASAVILRQQVGFTGLVLGVIGGIYFHQCDRKLSLVCLWIFLSYFNFFNRLQYRGFDRLPNSGHYDIQRLDWLFFACIKRNSLETHFNYGCGYLGCFNWINHRYSTDHPSNPPTSKVYRRRLCRESLGPVPGKCHHRNFFGCGYFSLMGLPFWIWFSQRFIYYRATFNPI